MNTVTDLRSALALLREAPGQLIETDTKVDANAELAGIYRHVGACGTVMRPTKEGPAMLFHNVKGHPDASVAIGVLASRERVGLLLDCPAEDLGKLLWKSTSHPIAPAVSADSAPCQEIVHQADEAGLRPIRAYTRAYEHAL